MRSETAVEKERKMSRKLARLGELYASNGIEAGKVGRGKSVTRN